MASTTVASSLSERETPRSGRGTPGIVVLPKLQVLSTSQTPAAHTPTPEADPPVCMPKLAREASQEVLVTAVTATIRELELEIEPRTQFNSNGTRAEQLKGRMRPEISSRDPEDQKAKRRFDHPERMRTVTWPALQYKLWIDTSNLSLHRLNTTERPMTTAHSLKGQSGRAAQAERMTASSSRKGTRNGRSDFPHVEGSFPEMWHVKSSHCHVNKSRDRGLTPSRKRDSTKTELIDGKRPTSRDNFPRLPSRLGRNSLDGFLNNSRVELLRNLQVDPRLKTQIDRHVTTTSSDTIASLKDPRIPALKLRGVTRNPGNMGHQEKAMVKKVKISTQSESRSEKPGVARSAGAKKLSFKIPFDSSTWENVEVDGTKDNQKWVTKGVTNTDVPPPPAPLHLEGAYHITKYISTK